MLKPQHHDNNNVRNRKDLSLTKQKFYHDKHCGKELSHLEPGDQVLMYEEDSQWEPAIVARKEATPRSYVLERNDGKQFRRNRNHIRKTKANFSKTQENDDDFDMPDQKNDNLKENINDEQKDKSEITEQPVIITRPGRSEKLPSKYQGFDLDK